MNRAGTLLTLALFLTGVVLEADAQMPQVPGLNQTASGSQPAPVSSAPIQQPGLLNGYVSDETYKLRAGDAASFQIVEDRVLGIQESPQLIVVADSGDVELPYIGRMKAVDKTCKELAADIKAALEKDYYKTATVVVSLNVANRLLGRVYIWGQVHNQGPLDIQVNENLTAGKAILRAGGLADFANKKHVKVVRSTLDLGGTNTTFELNMQQILEDGKTEKDIVLQPNDLIIVPSRLVNF